MKTKYPLVYLEWEDANSMSSWETNEQIDKWLKTDEDYGQVEQVGWLIRETKTCIILASRHAPENDYQDEHWGNLQKIPKTWIIKKVRISLKK